MNPDFRIIRNKDVVRLTALSSSTISKKRRTDPTFPKSVPLTDSNARGAPIGFVLGEVILWIESRISKREGQ